MRENPNPIPLRCNICGNEQMRGEYFRIGDHCITKEAGTPCPGVYKVDMRPSRAGKPQQPGEPDGSHT
jgi:hypothetical protein